MKEGRTLGQEAGPPLDLGDQIMFVHPRPLLHLGCGDSCQVLGVGGPKKGLWSMNLKELEDFKQVSLTQEPRGRTGWP